MKTGVIAMHRDFEVEHKVVIAKLRFGVILKIVKGIKRWW